MIVSASVLGGGAYQLLANDTLGQANQFLAAGVLAAVLFGFSAKTLGLYQLANILSPARSRRLVIGNWVLVLLLLTLMAFLFKVGAQYSRGSIVCFSVLALILLLAGRAALRAFIVFAMAQQWIEGRRVVVIGAREELASVDSVALLRHYGLTEIARSQVPTDKGNGFSLSAASQAVLSQALIAARQGGATEIVLALPWSETRQIELFRETLRTSPLPVQLLPDRRIRNFAFNPSFRVGSSFAVEVQRAPLSTVEKASKRALDIAGALIGLLLFAPLMAVTAIAIKLDSPGPVLFRQRRNGFNRKEFFIFKFRSMRVMEDDAKLIQARRSDPRITTIGRILRQTSIDELPQLLNVLKGDMSLVGPRPHALAHDSHYSEIVAEYAFRHHVKPGITGWAQVNGYRGETAQIEQMRQRVAHDLWYINNWSLMLDLTILVRTCVAVIRSQNAY
ncbi:undecaprenyl-phosphate glucose phosphotransferase [Bradyrhizobium sp. LHD-71]|uniref:undecaprenyl-phosphate glucose phosphotransferase n=1 Tax=Bradyrhizobium sp. LHD-71 TaxID=3072141 RepID=UPI00280F4FED|nr:undecaprenyl-phosphate glucose phosphotransferase [Bradyrhizobium sp. LHD-71]MDQ8732555.1 undecaprenyl-phosphate glucose phosphotransferase [Bradyrhizobium sp. LHD-71]